MKYSLAILIVTRSLAVSGELPVNPVLPDGLGVNIHFTGPRPGEMRMLAEAGFRWVRMDVLWHNTEVQKGRYDFSAYARLLDALDAHKLRPLFILCYGNKLYDKGQSPYTEEGRQAFVRWAVAAVERFKGRGVLWEIWNEPNARGFWAPEVNVEDFIKLALATGRALREAAPGEVLVGPAVAQTDSWFLDRCFRAGLLDYWSAVTVHPYRTTEPETVAERYRSLRTLIARYAPKGKRIPLWSGEWGYAVGAPGITVENQGKFLPRQWLTNVANDVPVSIWYDWHDDGPLPDEREHHFGTVRYTYHKGRNPVYDPKPAYQAARTLTTTLKGFRFDRRLDVGGASDYVLLFTRGGETRLAAWTTWPEPVTVEIPVAPGRFRVTAHTGETLPVLTAGEGGLRVVLTGAPQYLTPEAALRWTRQAGPRRPARAETAETDSSALRASFIEPPNDSKPMVRWWWFGPAVTNKEIEREIRFMEDGGFGGFQLDTDYPMTLDQPSKGLVNFNYLSKEHLDAVGFAANVARQHDMRMDLALGSGWPYGGPHIPLEQAAGRLRIYKVDAGPEATRVPLPRLGPGEEVIAAFAGPPLREAGDIRDGALHLPRAAHPRQVLFFSAGPTYMTVKRAAVGAEGFVLDHFNRGALERHLEAVGEKLLGAVAPGSVRAVFCDSLEVIGSDWARDTLEEFRRRRGYDLKPHLPALVTDAGEKTGAIRHDYGQTLSELFTERFLQPLQAWCRRRNVQLRLQPYGMPGPGMFSMEHVDLPEGEAPNWSQFSYLRWTSSASHNYGRPVTSSETWTWTHPPMFRATPLDLKAVADMHFLEGVNQIIGHGWPYSPPDAGTPGWTFYATVALDRRNPWWPVMPDLTRYLARVSFMLRQGQPANDIALYAPTDDAWALEHSIWAEQKPLEIALPAYIGARLGANLIPRLLEAGYNFDLVDDTVIGRIGKIDNGWLSVSGHRYRVIVLPGIERMPARTLRSLREFVRQGGILVATRRLPSEAPGWLGRQAQSAEITRIARELFEGPSARGHFVAEEREIGRRLTELHPPDVVFLPAAPVVGFVHRATDDGEIYFLANTSNRRQSVKASFRAAGLTPEWWDPFTGKASAAEEFQRGGRTVIPVDLAPHASCLLVFRKNPARAPRKARPEAAAEDLDISRDWLVVFDGGKKVLMNELRSWTNIEEMKFFSGQASYYKKVRAPESFVKDGTRVTLHLGEPAPVTAVPADGLRAWVEGPVREAAEVYVNGARAGSVWHPPYELDVSGLVTAGVNEVRISVTNLLVNRMADTPRPGGTLAERLAFHKELNARYGVRFHPEDLRDIEALPSGLLGPVRLIALKSVRPPTPSDPHAGSSSTSRAGSRRCLLRKRIR
ncbi:MAG: glycosyl hydrolase [Bryobacteraceae bacterium]